MHTLQRTIAASFSACCAVLHSAGNGGHVDFCAAATHYATETMIAAAGVLTRVVCQRAVPRVRCASAYAGSNSIRSALTIRPAAAGTRERATPVVFTHGMFHPSATTWAAAADVIEKLHRDGFVTA